MEIDPMDNDLDYPSQAKKQKSKAKEKVCKHHNKSLKKVMDFSFYICNDCGYQWKA